MTRRSGARAALALTLLAVLPRCGGGAGGEPERKAAATPAALDGKTLYEVRCAPCHGGEGRGDGPAAAAIQPKPRNFRDPDFWKGRSIAQLKLVVEQGKPGTLMPPFEGILSATEIGNVVVYLQSFRPSGS